jgi:hypothetical protein
MADGATDRDGGSVMLRERIIPSDLQSRHFATHLIERLGWAVEDAREVELSDARPDAPRAGTETAAAQAPARVVTTAS